ncbi:SAC3 family protein C [Zea mays]|uniref:SAC3 family protein C n=1 Tax=Zea mays TaxID=4577 RepID=A0A1D6PAA2_MAIZE|nr:SAC3 family protein C [Zea mays]
MDRRGEASHRGRSSYRGRGWRGRGRGGGRPSPSPPSSTASPAALNPVPSLTPAVPVDDAAPIMGTCPDMCPARERAQRERLRDLAVLERVDGDPARTSLSLAVKKFCRTISSTNVLASDIRPLPVLQETMDYLLHLLDSSEHPFETIHDFIFDRTRSIRQDLSMQNIVNDQAVQIYEDAIDSLSLWYGQLATPVRRSKEMIFARSLLRCYRLGNFKRFFCMVAAEATDLQLRLVEPFLNEVRARALMYFNYSGYKLQHHPLEHLSGILMIEESELESLCGICGLEITRSEGTKAFVPKQTSFNLPTSMPQSNGIYVSREFERLI